MQWASILLLAGLCSLSWAQYEEDSHWWFQFLRNQQSTYDDPYDPTPMSLMSLTPTGEKKVQLMLTALHPNQSPETAPRSATVPPTSPQPCTATIAISSTCPSSPPA